MSGESKNINKFFHRNIAGLIRLSLLTVTVLLSSRCAVLDPMMLNYSRDRDRIIEDVLKRDRLYRIQQQDQDALIFMLDDPDPLVRLTVLKLMEDNPSPAVYDAVLRAAADEDEAVSEEAFRILTEYWEEAGKAALRGLNSEDPLILRISIESILRKESRDYSNYLLTLFSDSRPEIRAAASRGYVRLNEYENPWFLSLLGHTNPLIRQTAVETLPRFGNPDLIPAMIPFITDPDTNVRTAALFGISEFDEKALPYLHETLRFSSDDILRMSVLQIIEGVLDPVSIPVLIRLLGDDSERIALKSADVLYRMGPDAVPLLVPEMERMEPDTLLRSFTLLGRFLDTGALPWLTPYFSHENEEIRHASIGTVRLYGTAASDHLITQLQSEDESVLQVSLELLTEFREPGLVYDMERADYRIQQTFLFFERMPEEAVSAYLAEVDLPVRIRSALENLYDIERNTKLYQDLKFRNAIADYPYFHYFRQWEESVLAAEISRKASFSYMHQFFETGVDQWLKESRSLRDTAALYDREAEQYRSLALRSGRTAVEEELLQVSEYLRSRRELAEDWRALTTDIKDLALLIFLRYSFDIQIMVSEYDFFRSMPRSSIPAPENL